jgi:putative transposase
VEQSGGAKANAGRRYRAYPTPEQAERLTEWGHACRAVWNLALEQRQYLYRHRGVTLRAVEQCTQLTQARGELAWLADLPAQSAQQVLRQLDRAYDNWWNPQHPAGPPTFNKRRNRLLVPFPGQAVKVRRRNRKWAQVWLPKIGWVRFRWSRPLGSVVRNATVGRDGLGWHIAFGVATDTQPAVPNGLPGCGVDFGVACSAYVSDESSPRLLPPTLTTGEQRRLRGLERRKARQVRWAKRHNRGRYSRRLRRTIAQIAALRARQARRRLDFTHNLTTRPGQEPRLGRDRGPAGEEHDRLGQRHRRSAGPQRSAEGRAEPRRPRQRPLRATPPAGLQGAKAWVGAAASAAGVHLADLFGVRAP